MPLHAQIACIGGNCLFAFFFLIAAGIGFGEGNFGLATFMAALAGAALYTAWVLLKFRKYLSAEKAIERELHIERMREEIDQLKANNQPSDR
jgi:hypothetical protein